VIGGEAMGSSVVCNLKSDPAFAGTSQGKEPRLESWTARNGGRI
jgi:hypothetical protein